MEAKVSLENWWKIADVLSFLPPKMQAIIDNTTTLTTKVPKCRKLLNNANEYTKNHNLELWRNL